MITGHGSNNKTMDRLIKILHLAEAGFGVICTIWILKYLMVGLPYFTELMKMLTEVGKYQ